MSTPIVECIANYSEARRPEVVQAIIDAINSVPQVNVLDRHSDQDHNRSVLTFIGPPAAIEEAAFRSIAKAAELINLDHHQGEHPRIGATDVVPFVPISGVTMQECVEIARRLGSRVGSELGVPVYLYEEAATRPERQNLENIRRGQYEGLMQEIAVNPDRAPDFGPAKLGPAGATVIGARQPLVAFNVYLNTNDLGVAKKIAQALRHSSGGLRYVKALGMLVDGRAQVSMNLTNFHSSPLARVVEIIRREAARYGVSVHHSELVGLIPQEALVDAAVWYMQLDQFEPDQILEKRMFAALSQGAPAAQTEMPTNQFLDDLAAGTPAPGGGSASAFSAAAAAALTAMCARLTVGKKKYADVEGQMQSVIEKAEALRASLTKAVETDAEAYTSVMNAFKLPKNTPEEETLRSAAIEKTTLGAIQVPLDVAGMSVQVLELVLTVVRFANINTISDGGVAGALARAAFSGAGLNVRINVKGMANSAPAQPMLDQLSSMQSQVDTLENEIQAALSGRGLAS